MKTILSEESKKNLNKEVTKQFATFYIDGRLYGIDVKRVQEVTRPMSVTLMGTAPDFVKGLINLRGQIATAIGLRELFGLKPDTSCEKMTVVCRVDDVLLSFLVDSIGEVMEVTDSSYEPMPRTVSSGIRTFMHGVYKTPNAILSVIDIENILGELNKKCA
jgi:purine-binding chemotaxis protein CheW